MRALVFLLLILPAAAAADPDEPEPAPQTKPENPEAQKHWEKGRTAFDRNRLDVAVAEIRLAYQIEPSPFLLYGLAVAEKYAGHCDKALELFRKYLYMEITDKQKQMTREAIKECEARSLVVSDDDHAKKRIVKPIEAHQATPWYKDAFGGVFAVSGTVGLAIGITFLAQASSTSDAAGMAYTLEQHEAGFRDASSQKTVGAVSLAVGFALAGGAAYFYLTHDRREHQTLVGTDGRSVSLLTRF